MTNLNLELPEIKLDENLRRLIWRELIALSREHQVTRDASKKRKIEKIFDALLLLITVVAIAAPLVLTCIAKVTIA